MESYKKDLNRYGIRVPEIMLPAENTDMGKWAVIACDQYTSQRDYWQKAAKITEDHPSTLNLIFPECYLDDEDGDERIKSINDKMKGYIDQSILSAPQEGFILVKRDAPNTESRWGLVAALDLEQYDFSNGSKSLIRATEGTILERIPPRVKIRKNALLELPHIMVLIDDPEQTVIESLITNKESFEKVYDFDLMMDSGHLTGYRISSSKDYERIAGAIASLGNEEKLKSRYDSDNGFLFAMGDGNHSLATAKTIWETYKKDHYDDPDLMNNPARWALVELVNIYSAGIQFEAIHRVLFDVETDNFYNSLIENKDFKLSKIPNLDKLVEIIEKTTDKQLCGLCNNEGNFLIEALKPSSSIIAGTIQNHIDKYLKKHGGSVDYIHGVEVTQKLGTQKGNIGIFLPAISKKTFFQTVINDGAFPRKTFSMGEASEKRFYVESRMIKRPC